MLAPRSTAQINDRESGQMIIIMVLAMSVVFIIGAITVDVGLWLSERRGAQTDADFIALAGAWELLDPGATEADAIAAANEALAGNDEQGNATFVEEPEVDLAQRCVSVDVDHGSRPLFFQIFGMGSPEIGAHARACAGAIQNPGNLVPIELDNNPGPCFDTNEQPIYTALCPIEMAAQGGNPRGMLDLQASGDFCSQSNGAGDIEDLMANGSSGTCLINSSGECDPDSNGPWYDCVAIQDGNPKKVIDGTNTRLERDGACDGSDPGGVDDFFETVEIIFDTGNPFTSLYEARDCDPFTEGIQISPRIVTIIVLEEPPPPGNTGHPIIAFAAFYIAGCAPEGHVVNSEADLDRYCNAPGNKHFNPSGELFVSAPGLGPLPRPHACHNGTSHGNQTCAPTPSPTATPTATPIPTETPGATGAPTDTPTPVPTPPNSGGPASCGAPGHCVVYGRFVKLIVAGGDIGGPSNESTLFGISLVE